MKNTSVYNLDPKALLWEVATEKDYSRLVYNENDTTNLLHKIRQLSVKVKNIQAFKFVETDIRVVKIQNIVKEIKSLSWFNTNDEYVSPNDRLTESTQNIKYLNETLEFLRTESVVSKFDINAVTKTREIYMDWVVQNKEMLSASYVLNSKIIPETRQLESDDESGTIDEKLETLIEAIITMLNSLEDELENKLIMMNVNIKTEDNIAKADKLFKKLDKFYADNCNVGDKE